MRLTSVVTATLNVTACFDGFTIRNGAGIHSAACATTVRGNRLSGNAANSGGGVCNASADPVMANRTNPDMAASRSLLGSGGKVWVSGGMYSGAMKIGATTSLSGGSAADETEREQRNSSRNLTIIDGQSQGRVV